MLSKKLAAIDKTRCVACGVCENTCPIGAVKVRRGVYAAVEAERCVGCGKCARLCPVAVSYTHLAKNTTGIALHSRQKENPNVPLSGFQKKRSKSSPARCWAQ